MKKTMLLTVFCILLLLSSCVKEYEGKAIKTITYLTYDYYGGGGFETVVNLEEGIVSNRESMLVINEIPEFNEMYVFDISKVDEFVDELFNIGFFELENSQTDKDEPGGKWYIRIEYEDDEFEEFSGSNELPNTLIKADNAFFDLYGDYLFTPLPDLEYAISYTVGGSTLGRQFRISPTIYNWHDDSFYEDAPFSLANENVAYDLNPEFDYHLALFESNFRFDFLEISIASYDLDGTNHELVDETTVNPYDITRYDLQLNRIYVITIIYTHGKCEYYISTKVVD